MKTTLQTATEELIKMQQLISPTHHWGFWRGNAKTLRQDTSVVGGARTVPQQLAIVQLLEGTVPLALSLSTDFEDLKTQRNGN